MGWLHEHGLIGSYDDYVGLPFAVLEDARLLMEQDALQAERERRKAGKGGGHG
jgi:hypothetical protein